MATKAMNGKGHEMVNILTKMAVGMSTALMQLKHHGCSVLVGDLARLFSRWALPVFTSTRCILIGAWR